MAGGPFGFVVGWRKGLGRIEKYELPAIGTVVKWQGEGVSSLTGQNLSLPVAGGLLASL